MKSKSELISMQKCQENQETMFRCTQTRNTLFSLSPAKVHSHDNFIRHFHFLPVCGQALQQDCACTRPAGHRWKPEQDKKVKTQISSWRSQGQGQDFRHHLITGSDNP